MTTLDKTEIETARDEFVHSTTKEQIERWAYKWADDLLSTADALSSLPAQAVGVKPLEWTKVDNANDDESEEAVTPFGGYVITTDPFTYSPTPAYYVDGPDWFKAQCASVPAAKAAAQSDYETRVRSSIVRQALRLPFDRDELGRVVREAWVHWAKTQPSPKPSWLVPYDDLTEADKEADRQIGEAVAALAPSQPAAVGERAEVIEECAKVADRIAAVFWNDEDENKGRGAETVADAIRALPARLAHRDRVKL